MSPEITPDELLLLLSEELSHVSGSAGMVFDADGTLWSGDVGDDLFFHAVEHDLLRDEASRALAHLAGAHGLETRGTPSELALSMYEAQTAGRFPERALYEMMAWCFAGLRVRELTEIAHEALAERGFKGRRLAALTPVLAWARAAGVQTVMVTASPQPVAEVAGATCGFLPEQIEGCRPLVRDDVVQPALSAPIPYGQEKARAGRRLLGETVCLAAFGDSAFDFDMLELARLPVAVRPKPDLLGRLSALDRALILS